MLVSFSYCSCSWDTAAGVSKCKNTATNEMCREVLGIWVRAEVAKGWGGNFLQRGQWHDWCTQRADLIHLNYFIMRHRTAIKRLPPRWMDAGRQPDNRINGLSLRFRFHPHSQEESDVTLLAWLQISQKGKGLMEGGSEPPDPKQAGVLGMNNVSKSNRPFWGQWTSLCAGLAGICWEEETSQLQAGPLGCCWSWMRISSVGDEMFIACQLRPTCCFQAGSLSWGWSCAVWAASFTFCFSWRIREVQNSHSQRVEGSCGSRAQSWRTHVNMACEQLQRGLLEPQLLPWPPFPTIRKEWKIFILTDCEQLL